MTNIFIFGKFAQCIPAEYIRIFIFRIFKQLNIFGYLCVQYFDIQIHLDIQSWGKKDIPYTLISVSIVSLSDRSDATRQASSRKMHRNLETIRANNYC